MTTTKVFGVLGCVALGLFLGCNGKTGPVVDGATKDSTAKDGSPKDAAKEPPAEGTRPTSIPSVAIMASRMNVFYIGVDNPIHLDVNGISSSKVRISITGAGGKIKSAGNRRYTVQVTEPGTCRITIYAEGRQINSREFRAKRLPTPVVKLNESMGGTMGTGSFKAQAGLHVAFEDIDFDVRPAVESYDVTYLAKRSDPVTVSNQGARFASRAKALIARARPGAIFMFTNVKVRCPGDSASRRTNDMVFTIR